MVGESFNRGEPQMSKSLFIMAASVLITGCTPGVGTSPGAASSEKIAANLSASVATSDSPTPTCQHFPYNYDSPIPICPNETVPTPGSHTPASETPATTPVVSTPVTTTPVVTSPIATTPVVTPAAPVCTPEMQYSLGRLMDRRFQVSVVDVAQNCIDAAVTNLAGNLPHDTFSHTRFMNTCGNRYCQQRLGFHAGRVIEHDDQGIATVECLHGTPPSGTGNACAESWSGPALVHTVVVSIDEVAQAGVDSAVPNVADSYPDRDLTRFQNVCGARYCRNHGFDDGLTVEHANGAALVNCYKDPANLFVNLDVSVDAIAMNCIDAAVTTFKGNLPSFDGNNRFMTTCGDRYCRSKGYVSGKVSEYYNGAANLKCMKAQP